MAYYSPRQRYDGRWDYCCENSAGVMPIGYCSAFVPSSELARYGLTDPAQQAAHDALAPNYHENGHATPEEAVACHKRYELDTSLRLKIVDQDCQRRCEVCGQWTQLMAFVGRVFTREFVLCADHNTRESVAALHLKDNQAGLE